MELLFTLVVVFALIAGFVLVLRRKIRALRDTVEFVTETGAQMLATGTRMSGLIQPHDDPVQGIVDGRFATVGLACLVLERAAPLSEDDWRGIRDAVVKHYRTGEMQAGDMVTLSQWLSDHLDAEADLARLADRAALLAGAEEVEQDLSAILETVARQTGRQAGPSLDAARDALNR